MGCKSKPFRAGLFCVNKKETVEMEKRGNVVHSTFLPLYIIQVNIVGSEVPERLVRSKINNFHTQMEVKHSMNTLVSKKKKERLFHVLNGIQQKDKKATIQK